MDSVKPFNPLGAPVSMMYPNHGYRLDTGAPKGLKVLCQLLPLRNRKFRLTVFQWLNCQETSLKWLEIIS